MASATVQNLSFLLESGPGELLEQPISTYSQLLRNTSGIETEHLDAIDYVVRHTVVRLLVRGAEEEELNDACSAIRRLVPVPMEEQLAAWLPRWRGFADLLEARLAVLANQDPARARQLAHAGEILALVKEEPGLTQAEIGKRLELKPANLSRILGVLEAQELIERRNIGRERRVHPGRTNKTENRKQPDDGLKRDSASLHPADSMHEMEYMYSDGHAHHFMNTENYEQIEIAEEDLGDAAAWLEPGLKIQVQFHDIKPIGVELPKTIKARIKETQPMVKGSTQSSPYKPATLDNGVVVQVPPFVTEGEEIMVDPVENRYLERAR